MALLHERRHDVGTAVVGGVAIEPVYEGELQGRSLGCDVQSFDEDGRPLIDEVGELVVTQPMPSMPLYFWKDPGGERLREAYLSITTAPSPPRGEEVS